MTTLKVDDGQFVVTTIATTTRKGNVIVPKDRKVQPTVSKWPTDLLILSGRKHRRPSHQELLKK